MKQELLVDLVHSLEFRNLLIKAGQYCGRNKWGTMPDKSKELIMTKGAWHYKNNVSGHDSFVGNKKVSLNGDVRWIMNYEGHISPEHIFKNLEISKKDIHSFLNKALQEINIRYPLRGPSRFEEIPLLYSSIVEQGDLSKFKGREFIYYHRTLCYEGNFRGGIVF